MHEDSAVLEEEDPTPQSASSAISTLASSIIGNEPLQGLGLKKIESASSASS
jgi:hypothetical protein